MQAIMETVFDAVYLITAITMGIFMLRRGGKAPRLFGAMAVTLGCGDAFHLVPRAYALWTTGLEANAAALGFGKFITSITMTIFYVLLYHVWQLRYGQGGKQLTAGIYGLAALRIILCLFPQNQWLIHNPPLLWGILRNIPFAALGIVIIVLFYRSAKTAGDTAFRYLWLAVVLSFGFYIPVVLFSAAVPAVGMLMIPKTLAYVWIVWMGFHHLDSQVETGRKRSL